MSHTRRDFLKTAGAAGIVIAGSDLIADLHQQRLGRLLVLGAGEDAMHGVGYLIGIAP